MPTVKTEPTYSFEFLIGERENCQIKKIKVASGLSLLAGAILAKTFVGTAAGVFDAGNTGNPTINTPTVYSKAIGGEYEILFTGATTFQIWDPTGRYLGTGSTGTAVLLRDRLGFTITAGATPAVAGDKCIITVTEGASTYKVATGSDAVAILAEDVDATNAATEGLAIVRNAMVVENLLGYGAMDAAHKALAKEALERRNIIARGGF